MFGKESKAEAMKKERESEQKASLPRAVFLKGFLFMEITHRGLSRPRYRPLLSVLVSEVKKSESEK